MATSTIPFSNSAGKNQTNPSPIITPSTSSTPIPGSPQAQPGSNSMIPAGAPGSSSSGFIPFQGGGATPQTSSSQGFITSGTDAGQNALQKQLDDIYGQGVGGSLFSLLNNMSGTDSTILQEYIQSLQPQMATAQSNTNAALGAGGVSANSSVAALADANLQSQEFSSIASESASLTQNQEQLTASILSGMEPAAAKEVATSGWSIFGDVMSDITGDVGHLFGGSVNTSPGSQGLSNLQNSVSTLNSAQAAESSGTGINVDNSDLYNPPTIASGASEDAVDTADDAAMSLAAFS